MNINIKKVPLAIFHFIIGAFSLYFISVYLPHIISAMDSTGLLTTGTGTIKGIVWFGAIIVSVLYMIGYPLWCLFEEEEGV